MSIVYIAIMQTRCDMTAEQYAACAADHDHSEISLPVNENATQTRSSHAVQRS